jgi:pyruvate dehydrogenase E1 component beta subunit
MLRVINKKFSSAVNEALFAVMKKDKNVILMGLGVDDPKAIFGTTKNLKNFFPDRVFDLPTAENGFTGFAIGLALNGKKPIINHQRVEFSLLSIDQIFNQAAKWNYMTAGKKNLPMVIRLIIGKGWGQGTQHSQSLEVIFSHIPGLKVVCPSTPYNAKGLMLSSVEDKNPVIYFEHRWLHDTIGKVPNKNYKIKIGKGRVVKKGSDISIISFSYALIECLKAWKILKKLGVNAEIIDLQSLKPIDKKIILNTARKTKKVLIVDNGWKIYGISSEVISIIAENIELKNMIIRRIGLADNPVPSTQALSKFCYPEVFNIIKIIEKMLKKNFSNLNKFYKKPKSFDQPNEEFLGPF